MAMPLYKNISMALSYIIHPMLHNPCDNIATHLLIKRLHFEYDHPLYAPLSPLMIASAVSATLFSADCKYVEITIPLLEISKQ